MPCERTKAWLSEHGVEFENRWILETPPDRAELEGIARLLPGGVRSLINPAKAGEPDYVREIAGRNLTDQQLLDVFARLPDLTLKPIVSTASHAVAGFDVAGLERAFGLRSAV